MLEKNQNALLWIIKKTGNVKFKVIILTILNSLVSLSSIYFALMLRAVIDAIHTGSRDLFIKQITVFINLVICQIILRALIRWLDEAVRVDTENKLKRYIYNVLLTRKYASLTAFHSGELQNRMTNDTTVIAEGMASILPNSVGMGVKLIGAAIILMRIDSVFTSIFIGGGAILLLISYMCRKLLKTLHKNIQEADGVVRSFLQETILNLLIVKSYHGETKATDLASHKMRTYKDKRMHRMMISNICTIGFSSVIYAGYIFGLTWCGFGILNGRITYGTLVAVLQLITQVQSPFANVTGYLPKYYAMTASAERLLEIEALPSDISTRALTDSERNHMYHDMSFIKASHISFSYTNDQKDAVLKDTSLVIHKGDFVAMTGQSGIGKSTFLRLLLDVYELDKGSLCIVDHNGHEKTIDASLRSLFAYVPQGHFLLSGTIASIVSFMNDECDYDKVASSCRIACADFIDDLPDKYNTIIGEKGEGLSEGQIQRLAIARAIYSGAPILLLDEATSALDETTEEKLLQNLKSLTDKTVIIVTHRKAALTVCNRIIEIKDKTFKEIK